MKKKHLVLIIGLVILADQALKLYIKTTFPLNTSHHVAGDWFQLYFVENPGMAYGWKFGGNWGKMALTIFRLGAVVFGTWYLGKLLRQQFDPADPVAIPQKDRHLYSKGFIVCAALIYAGALGNLIDSCFYGLIFDKGMLFDPVIGDYTGYSGLAEISNHGYASFLHGNVVDMLYFPIIKGHFPSWVPFWGGEDFEFFRPIFNIADAAISTGVITILMFQKRFFKQRPEVQSHTVETHALVDDNTQIS